MPRSTLLQTSRAASAPAPPPYPMLSVITRFHDGCFGSAATSTERSGPATSAQVRPLLSLCARACTGKAGSTSYSTSGGCIGSPSLGVHAVADQPRAVADRSRMAMRASSLPPSMAAAAWIEARTVAAAGLLPPPSDGGSTDRGPSTVAERWLGSTSDVHFFSLFLFLERITFVPTKDAYFSSAFFSWPTKVSLFTNEK
jgi:hypothetical protein